LLQFTVFQQFLFCKVDTTNCPTIAWTDMSDFKMLKFQSMQQEAGCWSVGKLNPKKKISKGLKKSYLFLRIAQQLAA